MSLPQRKVVRLQEYDYRTPGFYFVTVCTHEKQRLFEPIVWADLCVLSQNVGADLCVRPQPSSLPIVRRADTQVRPYEPYRTCNLSLLRV